MVSADIVKQLFYASLIMVLIQIINTISSTLLGQLYEYLPLILSVAFDCTLILYVIGIIRSGVENRVRKFWKLSSIFLFLAALSDLTVVILFYIFAQVWEISPIIFVRLALMIIYYLSLITGFTTHKFFFDDILKESEIKRKSDILISIGFLILLIPSILTWFSVYLYPANLEYWLQTTAFVLFLFAQFLIILGMFQLTSNLNILKQKFSKEHREETMLDENLITDKSQER